MNFTAAQPATMPATMPPAARGELDANSVSLSNHAEGLKAIEQTLNDLLTRLRSVNAVFYGPTPREVPAQTENKEPASALDHLAFRRANIVALVRSCHEEVNAVQAAF